MCAAMTTVVNEGRARACPCKQAFSDYGLVDSRLTFVRTFAAAASACERYGAGCCVEHDLGRERQHTPVSGSRSRSGRSSMTEYGKSLRHRWGSARTSYFVVVATDAPISDQRDAARRRWVTKPPVRIFQRVADGAAIRPHVTYRRQFRERRRGVAAGSQCRDDLRRRDIGSPATR